MIGLGGSIDMAAFARSEFGMALPVPLELGSATWFARLPDHSTLDEWFPRAQRRQSVTVGPVERFSLRNGSKAAVLGEIVAVGRRTGAASFFQETFEVMTGRETALSRSAGFRDLTAYLPGDHLAVSYLAGVRGADGSIVAPLSWWPSVREIVVGLYEGDGRIDIGIRALLAAPEHKPKLSRAAIDRLMRLPQTTLLAAATTIDFANLRRPRGEASPPGLLERYLAFLVGLQERSVPQSEGKPELGPHVVLAWGQDLREDGTIPQVALMVECANLQTVRMRTEQMVDGLLRSARVLEPQAALAIERKRHAGATISSVPLKDFADRSDNPLAKLFGNASPAWTVWKGWLILATSREHIERILDAQYRLIPSLGTVDDVRELRLQAADRVAVSIFQPDLATKVLDEWLANYDAGKPSILDPVWWGGQPGNDSGTKSSPLQGVALTEQRAVVIVGEIDPTSVAHHRLMEGDRIIGIDGSLLSASESKRDLITRWKENTVRSGPTIRVLRGEAVVDVNVPSRVGTRRSLGGRVDPAGAVRELAAFGRSLEFASYASDFTDVDHYSARILLRFRETHVSDANVDKPKP